MSEDVKNGPVLGIFGSLAQAFALPEIARLAKMERCNLL